MSIKQKIKIRNYEVVLERMTHIVYVSDKDNLTYWFINLFFASLFYLLPVKAWEIINKNYADIVMKPFLKMNITTGNYIIEKKYINIYVTKNDINIKLNFSVLRLLNNSNVMVALFKTMLHLINRIYDRPRPDLFIMFSVIV